jgi:hypothetical protein
MTVAIATVVLVATATALSGLPSRVSPLIQLSADSTALIMGGTSVSTPDNAYIGIVMNHFIAPTHAGQTITPVAVTTPEEFWPVTGIVRLGGSVFGSPGIWGPGSSAWPDEPWWKLSGLFDLTIDRSVRAGVADLEQAMAKNANDDLVIYGYSQGAVIANAEKRKLAEQYPAGTTAPDIDFVLSGDLNVPNGGLHARFPGLYLPILNWTFNGPEPTDTQFHSDVITRQYDGLADFPLYPLNLVADLNALLGIFYVHLNDFDVSLAPVASKSAAFQGTHGDTSYYFFPTQDLPLFAPLRALGVPESVIDVVEPFLRVLVELGYDRSIRPWVPTAARLIPRLDPAKVITDLVKAIGEGIDNARALFGLPARVSKSAPATLAAPAEEAASTDISRQVTLTDITPPNLRRTQTEQMGSTKRATGNAPASALTAPRVPSALALASTTERVKPALRPVTPRHMVRDSLGATEQPRGFPRRRNGPATSTTGTTAADRVTSAGSSSASSPLAGRTSSAGASSGGDGGGSN